MIGLQTPEAVLDRLLDISGLGALALIVHRQTELGCKHDAISARAQSASQEFFALTLCVDVGGVEKSNSRIKGSVKHPGGGLRVNTPAEVVASHADQGDTQRSDLSFFQAMLL